MFVLQVTEHTQFVDVYDLTESGLSYVHSSSLIPAGESKFREHDTLPRHLMLTFL